MKIIKKDLKNTIKLKITNLDDLWVLSNIIEKNDLLTASTERKIKLDTSSDRKKAIITKHINLTIKVEKVQFQNNTLRVNGLIQNEIEDIKKNSHHSIEIELNSLITLEKEHWLSFQLDKLEQSTKESSNILILTFDRENAYFGLLKQFGYSELSELESDMPKKGDTEKKESKYYQQIIKNLEEYDKRFGLNTLIIASPSFWKDDLAKELPQNLKKKSVLVTCYTLGKSSINELLKREELKSVLEKDQIAREIKIIEKLFESLSKSPEKTAYGFKEVKKAVEFGAVSMLAVTDALIQKYKDEDKYEELNGLLKQADNLKAEIHIISEKNEAGKKLKGLGGIASLLRFAI